MYNYKVDELPHYIQINDTFIHILKGLIVPCKRNRPKNKREIQFFICKKLFFKINYIIGTSKYKTGIKISFRKKKLSSSFLSFPIKRHYSLLFVYNNVQRNKKLFSLFEKK